LQGAIGRRRCRIVRGGAGGRRALCMWRGRCATVLIRVGTLWRALTGRRRAIVRLAARRRRRARIRGGRTSWRTRRARQITLLAGRLTICIRRACRRKRLPIGTVHGRRVSHPTPDGVRGDKSLRLCGDGREDAVLVEAHAVRAAAVVGGLEAGASDLASPAVPAGNGGPLARSWGLVSLGHVVGRRGRVSPIWVMGWRWRTARPLLGARQPVWLLM
jgi:hypothetical protein